MGTLQDKKDAVRLVADAAKIHCDHLISSLNDRYSPDSSNNESFKSARRSYINKLNDALSEVHRLKLDESLKVSERVSDLNLEESVDLLHAVEDHIRSLRHNSRSDLR